jgi:hypothetical protein
MHGELEMKATEFEDIEARIHVLDSESSVQLEVWYLMSPHPLGS